MTWVISNDGSNVFFHATAPGNTKAVYTLTKFLLALTPTPWTLPQWSSGSGSIQTDNGASLTSATQLNNNYAWVRLTMPGGGGREFTFQRSNSDDAQWRVKYTPSGGFVGGSPSVTQTPSATVEAIIAGGGTDASPTFGDIAGYPQASGNLLQRFFIVADNAAPYGWLLYSTMVYSGITYGMNQWFCDPLYPGSYSPLDQDPYVISMGHATNVWQINWVVTSWRQEAYSMQWGCMGSLASANYKSVYAPMIVNASESDGSTNVYVPGGCGTNPFTGRDDLFRIIWCRRSGAGAPAGYKGMSSMFHYNVCQRAYSDTITLNSTRDKMMLPPGTGRTGIWIPWNGSLPLI
jgi:hypothetical protein